MPSKRGLVSLLLIVIILIATIAGAVASGLINVLNPETARVPAIVPPRLVPPDQGDYVVYRAGRLIMPADHRPVAQLHLPPANLAQDIAVFFPNTQPPLTTDVSYGILASVRYTGQSHTVFVTTTRPSPSAAQMPMVLGDHTIKLDDGSTAWETTRIPGSTPNQIVFLKRDLIITVASDLPISSLRTLVAQTVVEQPY